MIAVGVILNYFVDFSQSLVEIVKRTLTMHQILSLLLSLLLLLEVVV